nr:DUF418 domain-containing protein [Bacillus cereus]
MYFFINSFNLILLKYWRKKFSRGPIEWIMRKLAG